MDWDGDGDLGKDLERLRDEGKVPACAARLQSAPTYGLSNSTHTPSPATGPTGEQACENQGFDAAQCVKVSLNYTYGDDSLLPDVGYGYVMPDNLSFSSEVRVS